jgi:hypothetical protein
MTDKLITCPPLCGAFVNAQPDGLRVVQWGLVEYLQDIVLPDALGTVELCDLVLRITKEIPERGPGQVGKQIRVGAKDWQALCALVSVRRNAPGGPVNLLATAICIRAGLVAADASADSPKPAAQPLLTTRPRRTAERRCPYDPTPIELPSGRRTCTSTTRGVPSRRRNCGLRWMRSTFG